MEIAKIQQFLNKKGLDLYEISYKTGLSIQTLYNFRAQKDGKSFNKRTILALTKYVRGALKNETRSIN